MCSWTAGGILEAMGGSLAYRFGVYQDKDEVVADARLLNENAACRAAEADLCAEADSHRDLARFLSIPEISISFNIPMSRFDEYIARFGSEEVTERSRFAEPGGPGSAFVVAELRAAHVEWLRTQPVAKVDVSRVAPFGELEDGFVAAIDECWADLSWDSVWNERAWGYSGVAITFNGTGSLTEDHRPGHHELFWHINRKFPGADELARRYAALIGREPEPPVPGW